MILFTPPDVAQAIGQWKATCGPTAAAAVMKKTCFDVRPFFPWFPKRRYTTLRDMENAMLSMGATLRFAPQGIWPHYGLVLIQFAIPGQPLSMRHSHWIGSSEGGKIIYDFNLNGWWSRKDWEQCAKELCEQCGAQTYVLHRGYECR